MRRTAAIRDRMMTGKENRREGKLPHFDWNEREAAAATDASQANAIEAADRRSEQAGMRGESGLREEGFGNRDENKGYFIAWVPLPTGAVRLRL
ncbi:hypothetical protein PDENDC454_01815 [Paenibacillus dendritiformis C454]|uniref:Uncharacterized protein n=2 Tax=Paenibacillus dendritiformis TaxID=130049 RepID=H3SA30_9BACL|nr:hypothetical protein [Paenibacillus dendritiformis]EHQ64054.1 hypothetical protein PDENDC454_01815 [Paenibacillus dendritiformis C454]